MNKIYKPQNTRLETSTPSQYGAQQRSEGEWKQEMWIRHAVTIEVVRRTSTHQRQIPIDGKVPLTIDDGSTFDLCREGE